MADIEHDGDGYVDIGSDSAASVAELEAAQLIQGVARMNLLPPTTDAKGAPLPDGARTKWLPSGTDGVALEVTVAKPEEENRVARARHALRVMLLHSHKLRTGRLGTYENWYTIAATMATMGVVVLQGVAADGGECEEAARTMQMLLEHHSNCGWAVAASHDGDVETQHVVFARHPIELLGCVTIVVYGRVRARVSLRDPQFAAEEDRAWTIDSIDAIDADGACALAGAPTESDTHRLAIGTVPASWSTDAYAAPLVDATEAERAAGATESARVCARAAARLDVSAARLELQMMPNVSQPAACGHSPVVVCARERGGA